MTARCTLLLLAMLWSTIAPRAAAAQPAPRVAAAQPAAPVVHTDPRPVQACLPTAGGELWVGGHGGLLRIDQRGRIAQRLTSLSGLPGTRVQALLAGSGRLLVGTERGLALLLRDAAGTWRVRAQRASADVRALARHRGAIYVGTWGAGLQRLSALDAASLRGLRRLAGGASLRVTALLSDGATLRVATAGAGLWRWREARLERDVQSPPLPSPLVFSLARFDGELVVGTLGGVLRGGRLLDGADARALDVAGGSLYVASFGSGLGELRSGERSLRWSSQVGRFVGALGRRGDRLCAGGQTRLGLLRAGAAPSTARLVGLGAGLHSNDLSALARVGDTLYVGSFDGGLAALARDTIRRIRGADPRIDALLAESRPGGAHRLYLGTARGLFRLELTAPAPRGVASQQPTLRRFGRADGLPHEHVHALLRLRDGRIVAGTGRGLAILDGERVRVVGPKQGLFVSAVWALEQGPHDVLWVGTSKGLYRWSGRARRALRFSVASGHLSDDWVTALARHGDALYVGTYNAGVVRLAPGATPAPTIGIAAGLPARSSAIARWEGTRLGGGWINFGGLRVLGGRWLTASTMSGLRAAPLGTTPPLALFALPDAALGADVTATLLAADGRSFWVASRRGLVRQPLSILPPPRDPDGC